MSVEVEFQPWLQIRKSVVGRALLALRQVNVLSKQLVIDDALLARWPHQFIPQRVVQAIMVEKDGMREKEPCSDCTILEQYSQKVGSGVAEVINVLPGVVLRAGSKQDERKEEETGREESDYEENRKEG